MMAQSFEAITDQNTQILILGSMPGVKSLDDQQYYAHPRNAFWTIMEALFDIKQHVKYDERLNLLKGSDIGLWDIYGRCYRKGSLDSAIDSSTVEFNNLEDLITQLPKLRVIACNGQAAHKALNKYIKQKSLDLKAKNIEVLSLPSTSPAYAAKSESEKIEMWAIIKAY